MILFLILYIIGVILNGLISVSIWMDLTEDKNLAKIRRAVVVFFVALSWVTWLYACIYYIADWLKRKDTKQ